MSEQLPPPPSQAVGQQTAPSTIVPHTPDLSRPHNGLAMVSLVTGILSFLGHIIPFVGPTLLALIAIICGVIARNQIRQTGEEGMTAATIGIVLGAINLALVAILIFVLVFVVFVLGFTVLGFSATHHS